MIRIDARILKRELAVMLPVLSSRNSMPILKAVKIDACDDGMSLVASTDSVVYESLIECNAARDVKMCVDLKMLFDVIKNMDGIVELDPTDVSLHIRSEASTYTLPIERYDEYPAITASDYKDIMRVDAEELKRGVSLIEGCIPRNSIREILSSVFLDVSDLEFNIAGSSYECVGKYKADVIEIFNEGSFAIPREHIPLLKTLSGDIAISSNGANMSFTGKNRALRVRLLDGSYPPYKKLFTQEEVLDRECRVICDSDRMNMSISAIRSVAYSDEQITTLDTGSLSMALCDDIYKITAVENMDYLNTDGAIKIAFNASLMQNIIAKYSGEAVIDFYGSNKPIFFGHGTNLRIMLAAIS